MPAAGQIVGGRYRLVRPLGEGGMATVWAAEHMTMGNIVAVKIISAELLECDLAIVRFNREARAAAKLRSPYVVQLFDHDVDPVLGPYIAMELLEGESLADRLDRERTMPPKDLCRILQQVGKGLMRAHAAGIVHRDLKPENIFLTVDDEAVETAKVLDFGVAKADSPLNVRGGNKTVAGALVGTLNYMSPEQAQGQEVNHRTDLWALGVIAFECLVGRRPFEDEAPGAVVMQICAHPMPVPSAINPGVPPGFDDWFAQACNRDPELRFSSSQELAQSLAHICDADELSIDDLLPLDDEEPVSGRDMSTPKPQAPPPPPTLPVPAPSAAVAESPAPTAPPPARKRRVLQLVDSTAPPPPGADEQADEMLEFDVDFDDEPEYFVTHGSTTAGPITLETLRVGYQAGYVAIDALLWTAGWPAWRKASEVFAILPERPRKRPAPNLALIGPTCAVPPGAPALPVPPPAAAAVPPPAPPPPAAALPPPAPPPPAALPPLPPPPVSPPRRALPPPRPTPPVPTPVSAVRPAPGKSPGRETTYFLTDDAITVGPVRASMLRRGLEAGTILNTVLVWRDGWDDWQPASSMIAELEAWPLAPLGMLRSRPGIESVGLKGRLPASAPPPVTRKRSRRSKG